MKRHAPAAERNRGPIADVLADELPPSGLVLEVASGTGEHAVHFARRFPEFQWQPSDPDPAALASIAARRADEAAANLLAPLELDAGAPFWPVESVAAILCINMIHISPPEATEGLIANSGRLLPPKGPLILYGPFLEQGVETAPSNLAFDASLRARNSCWGLRPVSWIDLLADRAGLARTRRVEMPANNLTLVYRRRA